MKEVNFITDFLRFWVLLQTVFGDVRLELGLKKNVSFFITPVVLVYNMTTPNRNRTITLLPNRIRKSRYLHIA